MTLHLYYDDPYRTEFDAQIVRCVEGDKGSMGVILDRTCFYPTSGGQPCDHGTLDGQAVLDVTEDQGDIVHWLAGPLAGPSVHGRIHWPRRFDHMQQHTGQHILSQAFEQLLDAQTVSFHLGAEVCTIDLDRPTLEAAEAEHVEDRANEIIFADRPVLTRILAPEEIGTLELRKAPTVQTDVRIVEVEGFDRSPCGGTHCARTGQVGPIAIRRWERRGQETRVEFVCGWRAVRDYRWKTATVNELALAFSVKDREMAAAVQRLMQEAADHRRELQRSREELLAGEADRLLAAGTVWHDSRIVRKAFAERDVPEVRKLASLLVAQPRTIALLGIAGTPSGCGGTEYRQQARLIFASSMDVPHDMAALLKKTCQAFGGSGGGQPHLAQGGGFPGEQTSAALDLAYQTLTTPNA
jgi:alanyl-tRNA synthetase